MCDQQCTDSAPTNAPPSSGVSFDDLGENLQKFGGNLDPGGRHFMCIPGGDSPGTAIDVDAPGIIVPPSVVVRLAVESSLGTQSVPSVRSASAPTGSSTPATSSPSHSAPDAPRVAAQIDPVTGGWCVAVSPSNFGIYGDPPLWIVCVRGSRGSACA